MPCVPDASSLIALSKINAVELLPRLYGKVILTAQVWEEAVTIGKAAGATDAAYLEKSASELRFQRVKLTRQEKQAVQRLREMGAGSGEAEVLAVASRHKALAVLDDKDARALAVSMSIAHVGTLGVLYEAFLHRMLSYEKLVELLEKLGRVAWISPDLLAGIIRRAGEVSK